MEPGGEQRVTEADALENAQAYVNYCESVGAEAQITNDGEGNVGVEITQQVDYTAP